MNKFIICDVCGITTDKNDSIENHHGQVTCEACETKRTLREEQAEVLNNGDCDCPNAKDGNHEPECR